MAEEWEFEEAIECFKVIDSSLRCIYAGEHHMYRALSTQLRILLCDRNPKPLLTRLFRNLELQRLEEPIAYPPGEFPEHLSHLNAVTVLASYPTTITCMPFEADIYFNGIEDCRPLLSKNKELLPIHEWTKQIITLHPVPVSVDKIIRTVADRGGGAHVHKDKDALLYGLHNKTATKMPKSALIIVAISKIMQKVGQSVIQMYERFGLKGSLPLKDFDTNHPFVRNAACVPAECLEHAKHSINLLIISRV